MGEEAKVSVVETALEVIPVPAVAPENKIIPALQEKKQIADHVHQNGDTFTVQKNVADPVSEIETSREKEVHHDQKEPVTSNTSSPPMSETGSIPLIKLNLLASSPTENSPGEAAVSEIITEKTPLNPTNRDVVLARVETEKRNALICAWEENEKAKIDNKTYKRLSAITSWENTKKAAVEAQIKEYEEQLQKKRAEYAERMQNKLAEIHKEAEENRALIEATKGQEYVKIEESATTYRATGGSPPKKFFSCLGC
ncbi:Remorin 1.4 [Linum perenne]